MYCLHRNSCYKDKTAVRLSYLYKGNPYTWEGGLHLEVKPGGWFSIQMTSYQNRKSHCGDKMIIWPSYLHRGISYTGKMTFFISNHSPRIHLANSEVMCIIIQWSVKLSEPSVTLKLFPHPLPAAGTNWIHLTKKFHEMGTPHPWFLSHEIVTNISQGRNWMILYGVT